MMMMMVMIMTTTTKPTTIGIHYRTYALIQVVAFYLSMKLWPDRCLRPVYKCTRAVLTRGALESNAFFWARTNIISGSASVIVVTAATTVQIALMQNKFKFNNF